MRRFPLREIGGGDLRLMTPDQWRKFYAQVDRTARRLFDSVCRKVAAHGPWVYARFWYLARELPIIKHSVDWREDTIRQHQEVVREQALALAKRKNPERNQERNAEIMRLHRRGRTAGQIAVAIKSRWPTMENGKPLTANAVKSVITSRTSKQRKRKRATTLDGTDNDHNRESRPR
jgi:hypothetical protein